MKEKQTLVPLNERFRKAEQHTFDFGSIVKRDKIRRQQWDRAMDKIRKTIKRSESKP